MIHTPMEERITLKSLRLFGHHGLFEEERIRGNRFELDVHIFGPFRQAGKEDQLHLAPDYSRISTVAEEILSGPPKQLIESLCFSIGERLFTEFTLATRLVVVLRKMDPPIVTPASHAEVEMQWTR